jgi:acetyl esterase/lipase
MDYAIDAELVPWLSMLPEIDLADVHQTRERAEIMVGQAPKYEPGVPVTIRDLEIPGPQGAPAIPVRIYTPDTGDDILPGLVFYHGGGFVSGSVPWFDADCSRIAADVSTVVVSVEYRLAPEHRFPAGVEDCYAALTWTASHAEELGIDTERLGIGGESAGGGLTAAVALMARDRGGPTACFQWLSVPELDDRLDSPSMTAFVDSPQFNRYNAELSWIHYLGEGVPGTPGVSPYAAPARAEDLTGLPRAFVAVCEFDPLRDEGLAYATRLIQSGVSTELIHYPGTFHGSHMVKAEISHRMMADQVNALRRGLHARSRQEMP